jgi:hypothetical protein
MRVTSIPDDFGGLIGYWLDGHAYLVRYGRGAPVEGIQFTPLNLLQARKLVDDLIRQGESNGSLTAEHREQSRQLPVAEGLDDVMPRGEVDEIAGAD